MFDPIVSLPLSLMNLSSSDPEHVVTCNVTAGHFNHCFSWIAFDKFDYLSDNASPCSLTCPIWVFRLLPRISYARVRYLLVSSLYRWTNVVEKMLWLWRLSKLLVQSLIEFFGISSHSDSLVQCHHPPPIPNMATPNANSVLYWNLNLIGFLSRLGSSQLDILISLLC